MAEERLIREPSRSQSRLEKAELEQETQALIRLLAEYSTRARQLTGEYRRNLERRGLIYGVYLTVVMLGIVEYTLAALISLDGHDLSLTYLTEGRAILALAVAVTPAAIGTYLAGVSLLAESRKRKLLRTEIQNAATKLARLIRMSSQTREHVATGWVERLELELAINDAEGAWLDAMEVSGGKSVSKKTITNLP